MSRQDANAAFALSSFLQGTNAAYIDDLYARYEQDPASVDIAADDDDDTTEPRDADSGRPGRGTTIDRHDAAPAAGGG